MLDDYEFSSRFSHNSISSSIIGQYIHLQIIMGSNQIRSFGKVQECRWHGTRHFPKKPMAFHPQCDVNTQQFTTRDSMTKEEAENASLMQLVWKVSQIMMMKVIMRLCTKLGYQIAKGCGLVSELDR